TNVILTVAFILFMILLLHLANKYLDSYQLRVVRLIAIYGVMAVSLNLINGITGIFSLGHAGFILIGAYTASLLTLSPEQKTMSFIIEPIVPWLANLHTDFFTATIAGGMMAALFAFLIGWPVLRLSGDYLAIASLGFAEVIRIIALNAISVTNGPLGLKGIPEYSNIWWCYGWLFVTVLFIASLVNSSYGRALKAIREDRIAAEAMGINVFKHQLLSFVTGAFFAGVSGSLYAHWVTTIDPRITTLGPMLTFYILIMIVLGGLGSISGSLIGAALFTILFEWLRDLEEPFNFFGIHVPGIKGMRILVISVIFILVMIFWRRGIMGREELTWNNLYNWIFARGKDGEDR
ncbi:branched-chain amino acid ABC transporter permease, partial [Thermotoga sp.]|uniref:branched-chain amino acid ABC transporter permease n=1 Tax=Thermotoga sp. TaxID=28240 RepID=UPI0025EF48D6